MVRRKTALLVIDVQNDFCSGGALAVPGGEEIVAPINQYMDEFSCVIVTQDWHPSDHQSFARTHPNKSPYDRVEMPYGPQILWPTHCVIGSHGAAFHPELHYDRADLVLRKGFRPSIDSYSAFFENDQKTPTGLGGYLRERGIETLELSGLATDFCVAYSALDSAKLGFDTTVHLSLCRAIDQDGSLDQAVEKMRACGVKLAP